MRLVTGRYPVATPAPVAHGQRRHARHDPARRQARRRQSQHRQADRGQAAAASTRRRQLPTIQVAMSTQTAAKFGLHAGSKFEMTGPESRRDREVVQGQRPGHRHRGPDRPDLELLDRRPHHRHPRPPGPDRQSVLGGRGHGRAGRDPGARALLQLGQSPARVGVPARRGRPHRSAGAAAEQRARHAHQPGADAHRQPRAGRPHPDHLLEPAVRTRTSSSPPRSRSTRCCGCST